MGFGNASSSRLFDELVLNHLAMQLIALQRPSLDGQRRNWHSSEGGSPNSPLTYIHTHCLPLPSARASKTRAGPVLLLSQSVADISRKHSHTGRFYTVCSGLIGLRAEQLLS